MSSTANVTVKVLENRTDTDAFLTLSKKSIQLFVGMANGTELDVKITTSDPDSLQLAVSGDFNIQLMVYFFVHVTLLQIQNFTM